MVISEFHSKQTHENDGQRLEDAYQHSQQEFSYQQQQHEYNTHQYQHEYLQRNKEFHQEQLQKDNIPHQELPQEKIQPNQFSDNAQDHHSGSAQTHSQMQQNQEISQQQNSYLQQYHVDPQQDLQEPRELGIQGQGNNYPFQQLKEDPIQPEDSYQQHLKEVSLDSQHQEVSVQSLQQEAHQDRPQEISKQLSDLTISTQPLKQEFNTTSQEIANPYLQKEVPHQLTPSTYQQFIQSSPHQQLQPQQNDVVQTHQQPNIPDPHQFSLPQDVPNQPQTDIINQPPQPNTALQTLQAENSDQPTQPEIPYYHSQPEVLNLPTQPEVLNLPTQPEVPNLPTQPEVLNLPTQAEGIHHHTQPEGLHHPLQPNAAHHPSKQEVPQLASTPESQPHPPESENSHHASQIVISHLPPHPELLHHPSQPEIAYHSYQVPQQDGSPQQVLQDVFKQQTLASGHPHQLSQLVPQHQDEYTNLKMQQGSSNKELQQEVPFEQLRENSPHQHKDASKLQFQHHKNLQHHSQDSINLHVHEGFHVTHQPPVTQPPATQSPVVLPPLTQPPVVLPPLTQPPVAIPPVTQSPVIQPQTSVTKLPEPQQQVSQYLNQQTKEVSLPPTQSEEQILHKADHFMPHSNNVCSDLSSELIPSVSSLSLNGSNNDKNIHRPSDKTAEFFNNGYIQNIPKMNAVTSIENNVASPNQAIENERLTPNGVNSIAQVNNSTDGLLTSFEQLPMGVKLAPAASVIKDIPMAANPIPLIIPGVVKLERQSPELKVQTEDSKKQLEESSMANVLPDFSRMVPGQSSRSESVPPQSLPPRTQQVVPEMPSDRVVTGNDNPYPVKIKQEPDQIRSSTESVDRIPSSSLGRREAIGSEEPSSRHYSSNNIGQYSDRHKEDRNGGWNREPIHDKDHSIDRHRRRERDRDRDRDRDYSREHYHSESTLERRSYDRESDRKYDDKKYHRRMSGEESEDELQYHENRSRRERAFMDELGTMDRYRGDKDQQSGDYGEKRRDFRDKSKSYYRSYDDDIFLDRTDRSRPVSRSSSINNLDNDGERSVHSHRSRNDYDHYYRDSHSRDRQLRDRDVLMDRDQRKVRDNDSPFSQDSRRNSRRDHYSSQRGYDYYNEQYGQRDMYDQYSYYYRYYRDHPYYKEYYRQWMQQYGQQYPEGYPEDRSSLHSGRSSVNDDMKKSATSQFVQDFHGRSSFGYEPSTIYAEASMSQSHLLSYPSGDVSAVGSNPDESVNESRMTPLLFGRAHIKARFTPSGQFLVVLPKDPRDGEKANVQIRNIQKTLLQNPECGKNIKKMQEFPGPLTIDETHKEVVVKYCERRIAEASADCQLSDKSSVILMWEYLVLLVRQNGRLYGTDIARLLLKGQNERFTSKDDQKDNETAAATPTALNNEHQANFINSPDSGLSLVNTTDFDLGSTNATEIPAVPAKNEAEILKTFTEYLCLGRKKEALDYAMQEGLWGHCLALAARMDPNSHTRVLTAFLNAIPRHNVLQTLFQQLTGRKPEITKTYSEERWGDWQSHLAMMISNPTGSTEKDQASVLSLGDTLAQRGQLHAAHFCYLLANAEWGVFSNKDSKIVLIGANHNLSFQEFASNESIQCTEIYEYGRSLEDKSSSLPSFQSYKLIYALRLTEAGLPQEALKYCEIISYVVEKSPTFPVDFLSQVYNLASSLKYNDVHYQMCQGELSEMPDPDWLIKLKQQLDSAVSKQYAESVAGYGSSNFSDYADQGAATSHPPEVSYQHQVSTNSNAEACSSQSNDYASGYYNNESNNVITENTDNSQDQQQLPVVQMMNPSNQQNETAEPNSVSMMAPTQSYTNNGHSSMSSPQLSDFVGVAGKDNIQQHEQQQPQQQQPQPQPQQQPQQQQQQQQHQQHHHQQQQQQH
ncbi:unnamed protein product, partial [Meganyctiphanes norvegica]